MITTRVRDWEVETFLLDTEANIDDILFIEKFDISILKIIMAREKNTFFIFSDNLIRDEVYEKVLKIIFAANAERTNAQKESIMFLQITKNITINADHIISIEKTYKQSYKNDKVAYFTEFTLTNDVFHQVRHKTDEEQDQYFNDIMKVLSNQNV